MYLVDLFSVSCSFGMYLELFQDFFFNATEMTETSLTLRKQRIQTELSQHYSLPACLELGI